MNIALRMQWAPRHHLRARLLLPNVQTEMRTANALPVEVYSAIRGPAGDAAPPPVLFGFGSVALSTVLVMPFAGTITDLIVDVESAFDGVGAQLAIGTDAEPERLMPAIGNALGQVATFVASPMKALPAGAEIRALYTAGAGASQGVARIYFAINPSPDTAPH